jgi:4-hydroxy-tetrahydrodipicolinate synthase
VTPFREGSLDGAAYERLIEQQIAAGVDGIVPVGTTGESPTVGHQEHVEIIRLAVAAAHGRCKVIAGTGSNSTREAITMTREAEAAGADAALLVAPYYNKPSQEGLFRHFQAIAESTGLPLILYSIPGRCGVEIGVETVRKLAAECPNVVSIKEAGGDVDRVSRLRAAVPGSFTILSGDDSLTLPFLAVGAVGVISVASNLIPADVCNLVRAFSAGKIDVALAAHERLYPLFKDLFIEPNPVPVKTALAWVNDWFSPEVRLPLCEMSASNLEKLRSTLVNLQLLPA